MSPLDAFTRHPAAVGETYGEHFVFATGVGKRMILAGLARTREALNTPVEDETNDPSARVKSGDSYRPISIRSDWSGL